MAIDTTLLLVNSNRSLEQLAPMKSMTPMSGEPVQTADLSKASFLDVFRGLYNNVVETNAQVDKDAIDLMLGNIDDLATMQANIEKANTAVDLLVAVKNEVIASYNSIINMQV